LWGFTAVLGDLIQLSAVVLVWWRTLLTCIVYLFFTKVWSQIWALPRATLWRFAGIGMILTAHWLCFYGAIKLANASIALICLSVTSLFSSFLEPLFNRSRIKWYEVSLGILIIPGIILIQQQYETTGGNFLLGFWVAILSAFLVSFVAVFNKKMIEKASPLAISFLEMGAGWLSLSLALGIGWLLNPDIQQQKFLPSLLDWQYLAILVIACTNIAQIFCFRAMKYLSAFAVNLTVNLEPVYGILLAILILKENRELSFTFYIGCALILTAILSYPFLKAKFEK
jgi:drug/metabolite transporter (DMT)-like permease